MVSMDWQKNIPCSVLWNVLLSPDTLATCDLFLSRFGKLGPLLVLITIGHMYEYDLNLIWQRLVYVLSDRMIELDCRWRTDQ
jgi:hypothetical protein